MRRVVLCLLFIFLPAVRNSAGESKENAAALKEFGTESLPPIENGFFFWEGRYIDAPYKIERRGLDAFINGICYRRGPEYPPYDYTVKDDPGDPPKDSSPLDDAPEGVDWRDTYWAKKHRYVFTHFKPEEACQKMLEVYKKVKRFKSVRFDPRSKYKILVQDEDGETGIKIGLSPRDEVTRAQFLDGARHNMDYLKGALVANSIEFMSRGGESAAGWREAQEIMGALLSDKTREQKTAVLEKTFIKKVLDTESIVDQFAPKEDLAARLARIAKNPNAKDIGGPPREVKIEHVLGLMRDGEPKIEFNLLFVNNTTTPFAGLARWARITRMETSDGKVVEGLVPKQDIMIIKESSANRFMARMNWDEKTTKLKAVSGTVQVLWGTQRTIVWRDPAASVGQKRAAGNFEFTLSAFSTDKEKANYEFALRLPRMPPELLDPWLRLAEINLIGEKDTLHANTGWNIPNNKVSCTTFLHAKDGAPKAIEFKFDDELRIEEVPFELKDVELKVIK